MKRAAVYIEQSKAGPIGGSQTSAAVLAGWLCQICDVDIIVRGDDFDLGALSTASSTDLSSARLRVVTATDRRRAVVIPESYDLFVAFVHDPPPRCPAPLGLLVVLFPSFDKADMWPWSHADEPSHGKLHIAARNALYDWDWRRRFAGYQIKTANSDYTRKWTLERWGFDSDIVYPPIDLATLALPKRAAILSVGRFGGKNQLEMLHAFGNLERNPKWPAGWEYRSVGGLSGDTESHAYYERCREAAAACSASLHANVESTILQRLFAESSIFWHARGFQEDAALHPERMEHFGMVTVEAMANGCVPVVIRRGGQSEIVRHGETGYLWDSLEEMQDYTLELATNPSRLSAMQALAREDARRFSREHFLAEMARLLREHGWVAKT